MNTDIRKLLEGVSNGTLSIEDALLKLKAASMSRSWASSSACPGSAGAMRRRSVGLSWLTAGAPWSSSRYRPWWSRGTCRP